MKFLKSALLVIAVTLSLHAVAREGVAIINHENVMIATNSGKAVQAEQVKQAIQAAAGTRNWSLSQQADGKLLATLTVRGKHTIMVEIAYAADKYSVNYKDSVNMNYGTRDGLPSIHPNYNKWVQHLQDGIRIELLKL